MACARPTATITPPSSGTATWASGSAGRLVLDVNELARQLGRPSSTLYALSAKNDPFFLPPAYEVASVPITALLRLDPGDPVVAAGGWPEALDDLRIRRRKRSEKLKDWRATVPLRAVSFRPALTEDKVDAEGVLQLHLEHLTASWARNDGSA
jgi:hypothetical protein